MEELTVGRNVYFKVNNELCTGCQRCIRGCPQKAISFDKFAQVALIDNAKCDRCGTCIKFCPIEGAIIIEPINEDEQES